jgi:hypothetical protein
MQPEMHAAKRRKLFGTPFRKLAAGLTRRFAKHKREIGAFAALFLLIFLSVVSLFLIDNRLFPAEVTSQFDDQKTFLEWYKKALEGYQSAASLFSIWAASCIVVGYSFIKDLKRTDKYVRTALVAFALLFLLSAFDLYLSQAYFSYLTYVFDNKYPVLSNTIANHVMVQKYTQLAMLINVAFLGGVSLIRRLMKETGE